ncbi:MAG: hypothetical protein DDT42_01366 [candidate division WS2 bacterium]|uniref:Zinc ribbon domain-containing protein n=1 Tax=Psychracetigena formicireducens TaxID=2986056 RepID=A0A9E2BJB6_PSYF1|nr:hypothetical protein [Candidatus Psychracetigena formicireducens]MBT9145495.1 hypothetical protein [Candidatus Psychracetigena formicireducens]
MPESYIDKNEGKVGYETTTAEKILAIALTVFLLIGGLRLAGAIDRLFPHPNYTLIRQEHFPANLEAEFFTLQQKYHELRVEVQRYTDAEARARLDYEKAREEYRTLLDRGVDDPVKKLRWEQTRNQLEQVQKNIETAQTTLNNFRADLFAPKEIIFRAAEQKFQEDFNRQARTRNLKAGISLLIYALIMFILSFLIFNFFRTRSGLSRYALIGVSFLGFGALQALIVSFRIVYPYLIGIIPVEAIVSIGGSTISIAGIVYLKNRFFSSRAIRNRRLWKKVCPVCGFPDPGNHCSWCGSAQLVECPSCKKLTNEYLPRCRECGEKL